MPQDKPLTAWKRKKVEVEARIKELEVLRKNSLAWLEKSSRTKAQFWKRTEYQEYLAKHQRLTRAVKETVLKLHQAESELAALNITIQKAEQKRRNRKHTSIAVGGILALVVLLALFSNFFILPSDSLTGAVISTPEIAEQTDSKDYIALPTEPIDEPIEEIPIIPRDPSEPAIPDKGITLPEPPTDNAEESKNITMPEPLPEEEDHEITILPPEAEENISETMPVMNGTIDNSTINSNATNATENADIEIQIIPTSHSGVNRYTFRHALGAQGAVLRGNGNDSNGNIVTGRFIVNPFQPGTNNISNFSQPIEYRANIGFLRNINTTVASTAAADTTPPNVTNMTPALNSRFNFSTLIEISANVTDSTAVSAVNITILLPNGSINPLTLSTTVLTGKYNTSYTIPNLTGFYNVTFGANDTLNNINSTEFTNFTAVNDAPVVYWAAPVHFQSITEGTITQIVNISFNVSDANGKDDIDNSSAQIRISLAGETDRFNTSCASGASTSTTIQFNCTVGIWYFDGAGSWTINVSVRDKSSTYAENRSTTFELLSTTAMTMAPNALTWPTLELGRTNQTANNDPIRINNTGNKNIVVGGVTATAYNLQGLTTTTDFINAGNFSLYPVNGTGSGGPLECNGTMMINGTNATTTSISTAISVANITKGNNSIDDGTGASGQEELFICLRFVPSQISRQTYNTGGGHTAPWTISVS